MLPKKDVRTRILVNDAVNKHNILSLETNCGHTIAKPKAPTACRKK